jgi:D-glycero-D-manno-heptose 1,7-bisphosphate phosphatase
MSDRACDGMPAIFIDRDGVINEHIAGGYVLRQDEFRWLPGAIDSLRRLSETGLPLFVVSNQSCVNRGLLERAALAGIMSAMVATLREGGVPCDGWICCPHRPDEGCPCRKPGAAMLERIATVRGVRLDESILIGDSPSDVEAAHNARARGVLVERNSPASLEAAVARIRGGAR